MGLVDSNRQFQLRRRRDPQRRLCTGLFEQLEERNVLAALVAINDPPAIVEGDSGFLSLDFTVTRSGDLTQPIVVSYSTSDGTAKAGTDYTAQANKITFASGSNTATISIPVLNDGLAEFDEQFSLRLDQVSVPGPGIVSPGRQELSSGSKPNDVVVADFNGDGKPDFATTNSELSSVVVQLNTTPQGSFVISTAAEQLFTVGGTAGQIAATDLNGDGKLDLVVLTGGASNLSVLLNTTTPGSSTATFAAKQDFILPYQGLAVGIGDFDLDGRPDLALSNYFNDRVSIVLNATVLGSMTVAFAMPQSFVTGSRPWGIGIGDLNGDGRPDLAVANETSNTISVLLNLTATGTSNITFSNRVDLAAQAQPLRVAVGDLNGDGIPDLAVASQSGKRVSVFMNTTAPGAVLPTFATRQSSPNDDGPTTVAMGDLNGDGKKDLVAGRQFYLNSTDLGSLVPNFPRLSLDTGNWAATGATNPTGLALADLNGDGQLDVAMVSPVRDKLTVILLQTAVTFGANNTVVVESSPKVISQDMNQDGKPDLLLVNSLAGSFSLFINTAEPGAATPSFASRQDFATGANPNWIAVSDVNGDGNLDVCVTEYDTDTVAVFLNSTVPGSFTGTFLPRQSFSVGDSPRALLATDLNGDGKPDLAIANEISNDVSILFNTSAVGAMMVSFAAAQSLPAGNDPTSISSGDLNGDGRIDLATTNFRSSNVSLFLNTTPSHSLTALFNSQVIPTPQSPNTVILADMNNDQKPDVLVGSNSYYVAVSVLINLTIPEAASVVLGTRQDLITGLFPISLTVADVDKNGTLDVLLVDSSFEVRQNLTLPGALSITLAGSTGFADGHGPMAIADLNSDGKLDAAILNPFGQPNQLAVTMNTTAFSGAEISFEAPHEHPAGLGAAAVALADINGDGRKDVVVANRDANTVTVSLGNSTPGALATTFSVPYNFPTGTGPTASSVADVNADGKPDLILANAASNTVSVLLNATPTGSTSLSFLPKQDFATGSRPTALVAGDFNGDGRVDLAVANSDSDSVTVLLNTTPLGSSVVSFASSASFQTGHHPGSIVAGDLNGDGSSDLAVGNFDSDSLSILLNATVPGTGVPLFLPKQDLVAAGKVTSIDIGDLNTDGKADLVIAQGSADSIGVYLNQFAPGSPSVNFAARIDLAVCPNPIAVDVQDFNGDGKPEIVAISSDAQTITTLTNQSVLGSSVPLFAIRRDQPTGTSPSAMTAGDIDGDGKIDVVLANPDANSFSVLRNLAPISVTRTSAVGTIQDNDNGIAGRNVFYNNSRFDGFDASTNPSDDNAVAQSSDPQLAKTALLPGQVATFKNYASFSLGLNGVMIDLAGRPAGPLSLSDFEFRVGNSDDTATWVAPVTMPELSIRSINSRIERVSLIWPDHAIQNQWLQLTVKANANTGLSAPDVFYFGNAVGETGDSAANAAVNATDEIRARQNPRTFLNLAAIDSTYDFNRDGFVNATDQIIARSNSTSLATSLRLINAPAAPQAMNLEVPTKNDMVGPVFVETSKTTASATASLLQNSAEISSAAYSGQKVFDEPFHALDVPESMLWNNGLGGASDLSVDELFELIAQAVLTGAD